MKTLALIFLLISTSAWAKIDKVIVYKEEREMNLLEKGKVVRTYNIRLSLSHNDPLFEPGPKRLRGDHKTPVGEYKIIKKRTNTNYRKSLLINYPNKQDIFWGKLHGYSVKELGDLILIHGEPIKPNKTLVDYAKKLGISEETVAAWLKDYFYPYFDWTNGCMAVNEFEINEIFELISVGTPIEIHTSKAKGMDRLRGYHSPK